MRRTKAVVVAAGLLAALTVVGMGMTKLLTPKESLTYQVVSNWQSGSGEVLQVAEKTGQTLARFATQHEPHIALSPKQDVLYLLDTQWSADLKTPTHTLAAIDTESGRVTASTHVEDRILYPAGHGPSGLIAALDGRRLFIYHYLVQGEATADYWLTAVDAKTLHSLPLRISLPGCGAARFETSGRRLVALCRGSQQAVFINPATGEIGERRGLSEYASAGRQH